MAGFNGPANALLAPGQAVGYACDGNPPGPGRPAAGLSDRRHRMRRTLPAAALVALVLIATAAAAATDPAAPLTYEKALKQAKQEGKVLVIDFYADW